MLHVGFKAVFSQDCCLEGGNLVVGSDDCPPANAAHEVYMWSVQRGGVDNLTFLHVSPASQSFLNQQIQGAVHRGNIDCSGPLLDLLVEKFSSLVPFAVRKGFQDHLSLGSDSETARFQL